MCIRKAKTRLRSVQEVSVFDTCPRRVGLKKCMYYI